MSNHYNNRNRSRRVNWGRILVALVIFVVIIILAFNAIAKAIGNKANAKNDNFLGTQEYTGIVDFTATNEAGNGTKSEIPTPVGETVWGIDVSHWQEQVVSEKWLANAKAAGCSFIYIQFGKTASEYSVDNPILDYSTLAIEFADAAEANQMCFGFYFLTNAKYEMQRLAEYGYILQFLQDVSAKGYTCNRLPLMLDHEVYGPDESKEDSNSRVKMLEKQISSLKGFGIKTIIYTSASKFEELAAALGSEQDFWLAEYSNVEPGVAPTSLPSDYNHQVAMWQYTSDALTVQERGLSVTTGDATENQQELDRNLMKAEYFVECVNN